MSVFRDPRGEQKGMEGWTRTYIVLPAVDSLAVEPSGADSLPLRRSLGVVLERRDVHRDPDKAVQSKDEVDAARKGVEMGFQTGDERGRESDQMSVFELKKGTSARSIDRGTRGKNGVTRRNEPFRTAATAYVTTSFRHPSETAPQRPEAAVERLQEMSSVREGQVRESTHVSLLEEPGQRKRGNQSAIELGKRDRQL